MQNLFLYKNKSLVALVLFLSLSLALMFFNVRFTGFNIRSVFFFLTYPVQYSISSVGKFFADSATGIVRIRALEEELNFTKERLVKYQEALLLYSQISKENQELRNVLSMKSNIVHSTKYAKVVFRDPTLLGDHFIIDKGSSDGLKQDMPVVSYDPDGRIFLVGKTSEINIYASKVKLLTSADSHIGVTLRTSGYVGILRGIGSWKQNCYIDYIPIEANAFMGEEVVTSGESDIYPPGILIGEIVGVGKTTSPEEFFKKIYVRPTFRFAKIRDVFVIDWKPGVDVGVLIGNMGAEHEK